MLTPVSPVILHSIRCAYCGSSLDFIPETGREEAIQIVSAHEAICEKNPLVRKLQLAKEEISLLEAVRNAAQYADECYTIGAEERLEEAMNRVTNAIKAHLQFVKEKSHGTNGID